MEPRLYIVMRRDLWDMNPGKGMAQAAHAQADFDLYMFADPKAAKSKEIADAVMAWREDRHFGTTLVLHETLDTFGKISMNVAHWGFTTDPTYPYRNHYGEVFTRSEVTCMWVFAYTEEDIEYMRQFDLHK
jgi:predicted TIM-barrel fold metal-dependent hydrolase